MKYPYRSLDKAALTVMLLSALIGLLFYKKGKYQRYYMPFLLCIVGGLLADMAGKYLARRGNNMLMFNIYIIMNFGMLFYGVYVITQKQKFKNIIKYLYGLLIIVHIVDYSFNGYELFLSNTFLLGSSIITSCYVYLLFETFSVNSFSIYHPIFWFSTGIILFHGCGVPYFGMLNYMLKYEYENASHLYAINDVLRIIYYSLMAVGFSLTYNYTRNHPKKLRSQ